MNKRYHTISNLAVMLMALLYAVVLTYILFFAFMPSVDEFGVRRGGVNLTVFQQLISAYVDGNGFLGSQAMLNILLFVPFGEFLYLFLPDGRGKMLKALAVTLSFCILVEVIQYYIGRAADIDDVLCNLAGAAMGCLGCAAYRLACRRRKVEPTLRTFKALVVSSLAALACCLALFTPLFIMDGLNAKSPYGIVRSAGFRLPLIDEMTGFLSNDVPSLIKYEYSIEDAAEECAAMAKRLGMNGALNDHGNGCFSVEDVDGIRSIAVFPHGTWVYRDKSKGGTNADMEEMISIAELALKEGESVSDISHDGVLTITSSDESVFYIQNQVYIEFYESLGCTITSRVLRARRTGFIEAISARRAYIESTFLGRTAPHGKISILLQEPEIVYLPHKNQIVPFYSFAYTVNGELFHSYVDAVKR